MGLIISAAMGMYNFQYAVRQSAEMANQMTSVDRIIEYGQLPPETSLESGYYKNFINNRVNAEFR